MLHPTSFRLSPEALEQLERLTPPGGSKAETIRRALALLSASEDGQDHTALMQRIAGIEARLTNLEQAHTLTSDGMHVRSGRDRRKSQDAPSAESVADHPAQ